MEDSSTLKSVKINQSCEATARAAHSRGDSRRVVLNGEIYLRYMK
jgi:hypothetical protein